MKQCLSLLSVLYSTLLKESYDIGCLLKMTESLLIVGAFLLLWNIYICMFLICFLLFVYNFGS